jgi:hypothetical protein
MSVLLTTTHVPDGFHTSYIMLKQNHLHWLYKLHDAQTKPSLLAIQVT